MKITKKDALNLAIETLSAVETPDHDAITVLQNMVDKLSTRKPVSDEYKAKVSAERKEKAHAARVALMDTVLPVIRKTLTGVPDGLTAKEIFSIAQNELPVDYTWQKVQAALLREMKPEVNVIEGTKKEPANRYVLR